MMRTACLALALCSVALSGPRLRFLQPSKLYYIGGMRGAEFGVQVWIPRHADNRAYRVEWFGDSCGGAMAGELDGADAGAVQPTEPVKVKAGTGLCAFSARVFDAKGKTRQAADLVVDVK